VLVVAIAGGFWWLQMRVEHLTQELARASRARTRWCRKRGAVARCAGDGQGVAGQGGRARRPNTETRDKQAALEQVYQDLMRNRDDWEIAEIQQLLTNAGQQLQLTGNVQVALAALQSADARLARSDKPQYNQLRRAIARDIGRMKAVPDTDLTGAAIKLDESINQIDSLPLLSGERMLDRTPGEGNKPAPAAPKGARPPRLPARRWQYGVATVDVRA
jgi:uroporphyrinogen III methyltransferase/synthase